MVGGLVNKKVIFIIQARMKSSRLPGKILLPLPSLVGRPLLQVITDELKSINLNHQIFVATSRNVENDLVEDFCILQNIECFRGDEDDVLSRFNSILKVNDCDVVVRLTADNPFVDINMLLTTLKYHFDNNNDYTKTENLPLGMNFEIISPSVLLGLENRELSFADREHVTLYIRNNEDYKRGIYTPRLNPALKELRLTIDYPSDFTLASLVLHYHENFNNTSYIESITKILVSYSWIFDSNAINIQKRQYLEESEEREMALDLLRKHELHKVADQLEKNA